MARRSFTVWQGALHALVLVALAACGNTDPPSMADGGIDAAVRVSKNLSLVIEPTGPHPLLPTEGFGKTVAISGARVAVADYLDWSYSGLAFPHVDTFEIVEGAAVPSGKLPTTGYGELCFGEAIGIAGDLLAVGEPCANQGAGAVHVYANVGGSWIEEEPLAPAIGAARFGATIALAANRMVIGAPAEDAPLPGGGVAAVGGGAYVYSRAGGKWTLAARLAPADLIAGDGFGGAVSMDASRIVATSPGRWNGLPGYPMGANGKAYLFELLPTGWGEVRSFVVGDGQNGEWTGRTVALCSGTIFIGSATWSWPAVHAFQEGLEGWTEGDLLDPSPPPSGFVDTLACDGDVLAVGMPYAGGPEEVWIGTARLFKKQGGSWSPLGEIAGGAAGDRAGHAVALDGTVVAVGVPSARVNGRALGIVRVARF